MADPNTVVADNNLSAPIMDQTPEEFEATRLQLLIEREQLEKQRAKLARQREDRERIETLRSHGHQVNNALCLHESDGVLLLLTPSHNLIAATMAEHAINLREGTPGHDELPRLKILMEEAALQ